MSLYHHIWATILAHPSMCKLFTFRTKDRQEIRVYARDAGEAATVAEAHKPNAGPLTLWDVHVAPRSWTHAN